MADKMIDVENLTYCGKEGQEIFSKNVYSLDLASYGITLMDGVKGKQKIYNGELGTVWQPYTCPFSPEGEVVLGEDFIEPAEIKVNLEECYDVFWPTYLVEQTKITLDGGIPKTFYDWFFNNWIFTFSHNYLTTSFINVSALEKSTFSSTHFLRIFVSFPMSKLTLRSAKNGSSIST